MRKFSLSALMALSIASPVVAQQPAPIEGDLRCVAVISAIIGNAPEGEQRLQMVAGVMYFIGRVNGQAPALDLKTELKRIIPTLTGQVVSDEGQRCGAILTEKGTQLQTMGAELAGDK